MNDITSMSPVILTVLGLLLAFSITSWVIIAHKLLVLRTIRSNTRTFADFFWSSGELASVDRETPETKDCPMVSVFKEGWKETQVQLGNPAAAHRDIGALDSIHRSLRKTAGEEAERLEKDLGFLATTASTTPFIGLFGTVWGIMSAFQNIGQAGSTSLAIVAPGISEALVTTAIGLGAAIPASIAYNYLRQKVRSVRAGVEGFSADYLNIAQKMLNQPR